MAADDASLAGSGRVAAVDFGAVRIGIAISDPDRTLASPYENYTRCGPQRDARRFQRLVAEEKVALFVVGLPVHADGRESEKSREARQFGRWLAEVTGVPVEWFDERFTSKEAEGFLLEAGMSKRGRKQRIDKVAAQILLAAYLESRHQGRRAPGPLDA
jgi:putative Holliday junction resolvase